MRDICAVTGFGLLASLALMTSACGPSAQNEGTLVAKASGAQIVFTAPPGGTAAQEVFTANLDGSNRTQITHDGLNKFLPHFSPDGSKLVYTKYIVGGYGDPTSKPVFAVYDLVTGKETVIADGGTAAIAQASWSPDGKRIATIELGVPHTGSEPAGSALTIMNADGSKPAKVGGPSGTPDDLYWSDIAWSPQDWILFVVGENVNGCNKARTDKIRPDGSARTQVSDGGTDCTPPGGMNPYGDSDPGWSADGLTIFSSRGMPPPPLLPAIRHAFAFSSEAWTSDKPETDLEAAEPTCAIAVPKGSPDGKRLLATRNCASDPSKYGVYVADVTAAAASNWRPVVVGAFGADWNPVAP